MYASFESEPLEDGINHPAEIIIGNSIRSIDSDRMFECLYRACIDTSIPPSPLQYCGALDGKYRPGTEMWRTDLVRKALETDEVEIRDAALQAAELWGGPEIRNVLTIKAHTEPLWWLRDYMQDVIETMG